MHTRERECGMPFTSIRFLISANMLFPGIPLCAVRPPVELLAYRRRDQIVITRPTVPLHPWNDTVAPSAAVLSSPGPLPRRSPPHPIPSLPSISIYMPYHRQREGDRRLFLNSWSHWIGRRRYLSFSSRFLWQEQQRLFGCCWSVAGGAASRFLRRAHSLRFEENTAVSSSFNKEISAQKTLRKRDYHPGT